MIPDPWLDLTWLHNSSIWAGHAWTYSTTFSVPTQAPQPSSVLLVLDGVKMGAAVQVNGRHVGVVRDQFLRYDFELTGLLPGTDANRLEIIFGDPVTNAPDKIAEDGRFMACTGECGLLDGHSFIA